MRTFNFDFDSQISGLESEWRQAYQSGLEARADVQALISQPEPDRLVLAGAHDRLERAESMKASIMAKIERLEKRILGRH
jgi:hypothetical protein